MRRFFLIFLMIAIPFLTPCQGTDRPSQPNPASQALQTPLPGGEFNKFFPADSGEFEVVYTQERTGFAQARLNHNDTEVATLSISDTANNPSAVDKFNNSANMIAGYPATSSGSKGTAVLVADRFQVQIRSKGADFTADEREDWLTKFDLSGLAKLK